MRTRPIRISVVPLVVTAFLVMSFLGPLPTVGGTGPGNNGTSEPPDEGKSNLVIGVAVVLVAVGVVWWLTRGKGESKEEKSDATLEAGQKASAEVRTEETRPTAKLSL